jgi:hypothetical protein
MYVSSSAAFGLFVVVTRDENVKMGVWNVQGVRRGCRCSEVTDRRGIAQVELAINSASTTPPTRSHNSGRHGHTHSIRCKERTEV